MSLRETTESSVHVGHYPSAKVPELPLINGTPREGDWVMEGCTSYSWTHPAEMQLICYVWFWVWRPA